MRLLTAFLILLLMMILPEYASAVSPLEEIPGSTSFILARRSLLADGAGDRLTHLESQLKERLRKQWQLDWDQLEEIGVVFATDDQPLRLVLQGKDLNSHKARAFLSRLAGGEIRSQTEKDCEILSADGLLDVECQPGRWIIHEGGIRFEGSTVAAQPFWRRMGTAIHNRNPEFFLFTPIGSPVADAIGRMLGEPEFIAEYRALALAVEKGNLILSVIPVQDADQDRMVHALLRRIGKDPLLNRVLDPKDATTGEVGLTVTMNFKADGCRLLLEELLQKTLDLIPDENETEAARSQCDRRRKKLISEIERNSLNPSGLNGRSTRSCPGGGRYYFREATTGPQIRCSRHP